MLLLDLCKCEPRPGPHSYLKITVELTDPELAEKFKETKKDNKNEEEKTYYKYCRYVLFWDISGPCQI